MSEKLIFGRTWKNIQDMQHKKEHVASIILGNNLPMATDTDMLLLQKHGIDYLRKNKFYGVIDRLHNSKILKK